MRKKLKVGDKVRVLTDIYSHKGYPRGSVATIHSFGSATKRPRFESKDGFSMFVVVRHTDIKKIEKKTLVIVQSS